MASIKVKFRPSTVADHEGTIYYQIIHERKVRQLLTDYEVFPAECKFKFEVGFYIMQYFKKQKCLPVNNFPMPKKSYLQKYLLTLQLGLQTISRR